MELLLQLIGLVAQVVATATGRALVAAATLGRWRVERGNESHIHSAAGSLSFRVDGERVVTETAAVLVGLAFYGVLVAAAVWQFA